MLFDGLFLAVVAEETAVCVHAKFDFSIWRENGNAIVNALMTASSFISHSIIHPSLIVRYEIKFYQLRVILAST